MRPRSRPPDRAARARPMSTNSPPLRYSGRPVSPSMSVTAKPAHSQRLDQRIGQPLRQLVERHEARRGVVGSISGWRQESPRSTPPSVDAARPDRAEMRRAALSRIARRRQRAVLAPAPRARSNRPPGRGSSRCRTRRASAATVAPSRLSSAARPSSPTSGLPAVTWKPVRELLGVEARQRARHRRAADRRDRPRTRPPRTCRKLATAKPFGARDDLARSRPRDSARPARRRHRAARDVIARSKAARARAAASATRACAASSAQRSTPPTTKCRQRAWNGMSSVGIVRRGSVSAT